MHPIAMVVPSAQQMQFATACLAPVNPGGSLVALDQPLEYVLLQSLSPDSLHPIHLLFSNATVSSEKARQMPALHAQLVWDLITCLSARKFPLNVTDHEAAM